MNLLDRIVCIGRLQPGKWVYIDWKKPHFLNNAPVFITKLLYHMADVHSKTTRSYNMSQIKGKNTKPEMLVRKYLHRNGFRYKLHDKSLPGKPDLVLPKYNTIIFIHGCFWHAHEGCKYFVIPKTRTDWWKNKIYSNRNRDKENQKRLLEKGWKVIQVWECDLKSANINQTLKRLADQIKINEQTGN